MESDLPTDYVQRVNRKAAGHSLLEMMTVVLLILIVASISVPAYQTVRVRARKEGRCRVSGVRCQVSGTQ